MWAVIGTGNNDVPGPGDVLSWQATSWAKATTGHRSHGDKLLLMILADYAHPETWEAWPNQETLAEHCEMSKSGIVRSLNSLSAGGFITRIQKGNQHQCSIYKIGAGAHSCESGVSASGVTPHTGASGVSDTVQVAFEAGASGVPLHTRNQEEPIEEPNLLKPQEWVEILASDPRWAAPKNGYIEQIESEYGSTINLALEAQACLEWMQNNPKGKKRKRIMPTWINWLKSNKKDLSNSSQHNGNHATRAGYLPNAAELKAAWGTK